LLTAAQEGEIHSWITENHNITIDHLNKMILEKMQIEISKSTTHKINAEA
jgi:hypothetical protein